MVEPVVVTGVGALTSLGLTAEATWSEVVAGNSGIRTIERIEHADLAVHYAGEAVDFDPELHLSRSDCRRLDPQTILGIIAGREALASAGILGPNDVPDPESLAILAPTGYGPTRIIETAISALDEAGPRHVSPYLTVFGSPDTVSAHLSLEYGARGENFSLAAACASGTVAIGLALRMLRHGYASKVLVVGAEDTVTRKDLSSTANTRALSTGFVNEPHRASRPFDLDRDGFVMSSGSAALLLETETSARARSATVLARVLGYGGSSDAHHPTAPHPEGAGASLAMRRALDDARLDVTDIDYVNAHGTSTPMNDRIELRAVEGVLGAQAHRIPISSTKSVTGHLLGAAGVLEAVLTVLALRDATAPPTINLDRPEFPAFNLVPHVAQHHAMNVAMSNSFGFGGHNSAILLGRGQG